MNIIGINCYHGDSSACLIRDGELLAAAEEERFRRVKHWAGFPSAAIGYCLEHARTSLSEVDCIAVNQDPSANFWRKVGYAITRRPDLSLVFDRIRNRRERAGFPEELSKSFPGQTFNGRIRFVEHHLSHLASAYLASPFKRATVVSVDGFGDFSSAAWGTGVGQEIGVEAKVHFPHSLGIFYQALTQYLGFWNYGDEYKVMGLAPYGTPTRLDAMRKIVRLQGDGAFRLQLDYFRHHREKVEYEWHNCEPRVGKLFSAALDDLLGPARKPGEALTQEHKDIARSIQAMYEEAFFHLLNTLHGRHGYDSLALAGGCAMNSVANGRVYRQTPYKKVYVQSAAGDAGGAIGAALLAWHEVAGANFVGQRFHMAHAYWGPEASDVELAALLEARGGALQAAACKVRRIDDEAELCRMTADAIADGRVIGWFQGRMEWGPRALGNRSILGDPRRADMKDILNLKIKRRESFRPFAPSILRDAVPAWFEVDDDVPFMMQVYPIRKEKRATIPAVTHVDGSGRLQTVSREANPRYYRLIEAFADKTGVPIVLNTSFNENEPVVCKPEEALDCFLRTRMDVLVLNDWFVERQNEPESGGI